MISKKEKGLGYDYSAFLDYTSSNDFSLYEIGNYHCPPGYSYGPVIRSRAIFHYIYSGKGRLVLENKEFLLEANQGFLIPAGKKAFYEADYSDPWSYSWLHIGGPKMLEVYKEAGLSIQEYLMQYRMKSAMKLMEDPALSIQYISFAVGYNDVFTFSKAFKKHVGISPSEYRKSIV